MLTSGQLAALQRIHKQTAMPDQAIILTRTLTTDGRGGQTASYTESQTVACRIAFYSNRPALPDAGITGQVKAAEKYLVSLPVGTEISATDRLKIKGVTYEILSPNDDGQSADALTGGRSFQTALRLLVQRI